MSLLPNKSHLKPDQPLYLPYFAAGTLNASTISTQYLTADFISTQVLEASTISTNVLDLDGQLLTANGTELLLNGIPIATQSSLSTIADWSLDPAISTVQMAGNNITQAGNISTTSIVGGTGFFTNLMALNSMFLSTYTSTVSTQINVAELGLYSTLNAGTISTQSIAADQGDVQNINISSINGQPFTTGSGGDAANWAYYKALSDIDCNGKDVVNAQNIEFYSLDRTGGPLGGNINAGDIQCDNLTVGNTVTNLADVAIYGVNALPGDNALYVEGGTTLTGGGIVHGVTIGALQVGGIDTNRIDVIPAGIGINAATYIQLAAAGAGSFAAGGALSLAGGNYVEINTGEIQCINTTSGQSFLSVNNVQGNTHNGGDGTLEIHNVTRFEGTNIQMTNISSINGQPISFYEPGSVSTVSTFVDVNAQVLNLIADASARCGAPYLDAPSGNSTFEVFNTGAPQYSAPLRASQLVLSYAGLTSNDFTGDVIITNYVGGATPPRLSVSNNTTGNAQIAYLSDIPPVVSSFQDLGTDTLRVSTINMEGTGDILWDNGATIFEAGAGKLSLSNGGATKIDMLPSGIDFSEGGLGGVMSFLDNHLAVSAISSFGIATETLLTSSFTTSSIRANWGQISTLGVVSGVAGAGASASVDGFNLIRGATGNFTTLSTGTASASLYQVLGLSTIQISTTNAAGSAAQPAGRLLISGNDLDLGQQDLWAQQIRLGASNPGGSAQTEVIWYSPDNLTTRGIGLGGSDLTLRLQSTINTGTNNGYLLDTTVNPPFFSTINAGTSTALCAAFPSTNLGTIGYSTISVLPPLTYIASVYDSTTQTVAAANTSTPLIWNTTALNLGGYTVGTSSLTVPVAGVYELQGSIQFATASGGTNEAEFWLTKNGLAVPQTNSRVAVVNNGDTLGNVAIFDQAAAGDRYGWMIYSSDNNMAATAVAAGAVPAIPSIIFNAKRIG